MTVDDQFALRFVRVEEVCVRELAAYLVPGDLVGLAVEQGDAYAVGGGVLVPDHAPAPLGDQVEAELGRRDEEDRVVWRWELAPAGK